MSARARTPPRLRLKAAASVLMGLPWDQPLGSWSSADACVVEVPLGAGRHVVRVVRAGGRLWALKDLPRRAAEREHAALVALEARGVPAVRTAGLVTHEADGSAVLITEYLPDAVLWRDLLTGMSASPEHRARVYEAVAVFLVDLHRRGVFWGDCSLSNLLFRRDGHALQPVLVDAETAELPPSLTAGRRRHDLTILEDNLAGGLLDLQAEIGDPVDLEQLRAETRSIRERYEGLWQTVHAAPTLPFEERLDVASEVARLNDLGYSIEELRLASIGSGRGEVRLHTVVAARRHHADELERLTGLQVGEGQASVLLRDLRSHGRVGPSRSELEVARSWLEQVLHPAVARLRAALPGPRDVVQSYCDLLEVRWLLSERAGRDVGTEAAVQVLAAGRIPAGAAAQLDRLAVQALRWDDPPAQEHRRTA